MFSSCAKTTKQYEIRRHEREGDVSGCVHTKCADFSLGPATTEVVTRTEAPAFFARQSRLKRKTLVAATLRHSEPPFRLFRVLDDDGGYCEFSYHPLRCFEQHTLFCSAGTTWLSRRCCLGGSIISTRVSSVKALLPDKVDKNWLPQTLELRRVFPLTLCGESFRPTNCVWCEHGVILPNSRFGSSR